MHALLDNPTLQVYIYLISAKAAELKTLSLHKSEMQTKLKEICNIGIITSSPSFLNSVLASIFAILQQPCTECMN